MSANFERDEIALAALAVESAARAAADTAHAALTTSVHGIPDTSKLAKFASGNAAGSVISAVDGTASAIDAKTNPRAVTANATAVDGDVMLCDATSGNVTITLPAATTAGRRVAVKKIDASANTVTITGTIDGTVNPVLRTRYHSIEIVSDGTNWVRAIRPALSGLVDVDVSSLTTPDTSGKALILSKDASGKVSAAPGLVDSSSHTAEQYGAIGNGVTDDTTALNAAIAAISAAGGGELLLTKQYKLTMPEAGGVSASSGITVRGALRLKTGVRIRGGGKIICPDSTSQSGYRACFYDDGTATGWSIQDISIDGQYSTVPPTEAFHRPLIVGPCTDFSIVNVETFHFKGAAFSVIGDGTPSTNVPKRFRISGCNIHDSQGPGIDLSRGASDFFVTGNFIHDALGGAEAILGSFTNDAAATALARGEITGNTMVGWGNLVPGKITDCLVADNIIKMPANSLGNGLVIHDCVNSTVARNHVDMGAVTTPGLIPLIVSSGAACDRLRLLDNTLRRQAVAGAGDGIVLQTTLQATKTTVAGNSVDDNGQATTGYSLRLRYVTGLIANRNRGARMYLGIDVSGFTCEANECDGTFAIDASDGTFTGNHSAGSNGDNEALRLTGSRVAITGNNLNSAAAFSGSGTIYISGSNNVIDGNVIKQTVANQHAIYEDDAANANIVRNNQISAVTSSAAVRRPATQTTISKWMANIGYTSTADRLALAGSGCGGYKAAFYHYGEYVGQSAGTVVPTVGMTWPVPIWLPGDQAFDRIGCETTVAAAAGGLLRFGIYTIGNDGLPATLVLDAGTIASDDAAGFHEVALTNFTPQEGLYALVVACQVAAATLRNAALRPKGPLKSRIDGNVCVHRDNGSTITGAMPANYPVAFLLVDARAPVIYLRGA